MIRKIKFFLKTYFGFTNRESRGFILLLPSVILLYSIPLIYNNFLNRSQAFDQSQYQNQIDSLESNGWFKVNSMLNFSNYLQDTTKSNAKFPSKKSEVYKMLSFDDADSIILQIVPGIGQVMAGRIVKFRDAIGGMHSKDQLMDVFGMTPEVNERVFEYFEFEPGIKNKININASDVQGLALHPYINYGSAKVIVAYRDQHGKYEGPDDLMKVRIFTKEWIDKIAPYLDF